MREYLEYEARAYLVRLGIQRLGPDPAPTPIILENPTLFSLLDGSLEEQLPRLPSPSLAPLLQSSRSIIQQ